MANEKEKEKNLQIQEQLSEKYIQNPVTGKFADLICEDIVKIINEHELDQNTKIQKLYFYIFVNKSGVDTLVFKDYAYWDDNANKLKEVKHLLYQVPLRDELGSCFINHKSFYKKFSTCHMFYEYGMVNFRNNNEIYAFRKSLFQLLNDKFSAQDNFSIICGFQDMPLQFLIDDINVSRSDRIFTNYYKDRIGFAIIYSCPTYIEPKSSKNEWWQ